MSKIFKKWWFWAIIVLVSIFLFFPIWCTTAYLPGINGTLIEKTYCNNLFGIGQVYS